MQAIILAAGKGSRLSPYTDHTPKCLLKIGDKPLLDYQIELFKANGVQQIIIVTGNMREQVENHVMADPNIFTVYNENFAETNVLGSFAIGMDLLRDDFYYAHADTIFDVPVISAIRKQSGDIVLPIDVKPCGEEEMKVQLDEKGEIRYINKTMDPAEALGEFLGVAKFSKNVLPALKQATKEILQKERKTAFFERAIQMLINEKQHEIRWVDVTGLYWQEIDFPEDYRNAINRFSSSALYENRMR